MSLFQKCPTCGSFSFAQPGGLFRCNNGHVFKITDGEKTGDDGVWNAMPEWARKLKEATKT